MKGDATYVGNRSRDWSRKKADWRGMRPVLVRRREFCLGEMAEDGGHGHLTHAPRRTKVELEAVVLDVLIARIALGAESAQTASGALVLGCALTVCI